MKKINVFIALCISAFVSLMLGRSAPSLVHGTVAHLTVFAVVFAILLFVIRGRTSGVKRQRPPIQPAARAQVSSQAPTSTPRSASTDATPSSDPNQKIDVIAELQPDSSVLVVVIVTGYSGAEFKKRIRPRLENIAAVKWKHPTNLGDGARKMEGTIKPGTRADLAVAAVRSVS